MNEKPAAALRNLDYQDPELIELKRKAITDGQNITGLSQDQSHFLGEIDTLLEEAPIVSSFDLTQNETLRNNT